MGDSEVSNADVSRLLDALEEAIDELRIAYEKYFSGVDRQAPSRKHQKVTAELRRVEQIRPRSTALRFRLAGLKARMVTYSHYWTRVLGQIERGTFRRDIQRRVQRRHAEAASGEVEAGSPEAAGSPESAAPEPGAPTPKARRGEPSRPVPAVPGMQGVEVQHLFQELVRAKRAAGEDTQGLTVRALARKLSRELPKLQERHGAGVRFEVATVRGKVRLRARSSSE